MKSIDYAMFTERLKKWMDENEVTQKDLIKETGYSKSKISLIVSGKQRPDNDFLEVLTSLSSKNINWWLTGDNKYQVWSSLDKLVNVFIENGFIDDEGNIKDVAEATLIEMMKKEIKDLVNIKKEQ